MIQKIVTRISQNILEWYSLYTCLHTKESSSRKKIIINYVGIAMVASNEKPQMRYKMRRVNRRPALRSNTMTKIMAGNSMAENKRL